jgi:hypothetical protein
VFTTALLSIKTWRDSNPGSSGLAADAMTTPPGRAAAFFNNSSHGKFEILIYIVFPQA